MRAASRLVPLLLLAAPPSLSAQRPPAPLACEAAAIGSPSGLLGRALRAVGPRSGALLRVRSWRGTLQDYQSDRSYAPFFSIYESVETLLDMRSGALRSAGQGGAFPAQPLPAGGPALLIGPRAAWFLRGEQPVALPDWSQFAARRPLNPWAVLGDFQRSRDARTAGRCRYRDFDRLALAREGPVGPEFLLLDARTFVPVALVREEPHFLWGQVIAEYVWSNWEGIGDGAYPLTAFRMVDGVTEVSETITAAERVPVDSVPPLTLPDTLARPAVSSAILSPERPDTIRVGPDTWLLASRQYTTAVTLRRDTVFVLDATLSEARARQDAEWIAQLFPGRHPVVLVVTDLAWPHIGGVRTWVARGAAIVTHRASEAFLRRVVERRWTRASDTLESARAGARLRIRAVQDSLPLAGGELVVHVLDEVASEGAVVAWVPGDGFLWAGDYVQNLRRPTQYARDVHAAARRAGLTPTQFSAQHLRLTRWAVLDSLLAPEQRDVATTVHPATLDGGLLRPGTSDISMAMRRPDGTERTGAARTESRAHVTWRGRRALMIVHQATTPRGPFADTSIADSATLLPLAHASAGAGRTMRLNFDGTSVTGSITPDGRPAEPLSQRLPVRPYDSTIWDHVVAALPLREGYQTRVPFYVYEQGGLVWYTASVLQADTAAGRPAWVVDVTEDGEQRGRLWITKDTREVLRTAMQVQGMAITMTRQ